MKPGRGLGGLSCFGSSGDDEVSDLQGGGTPRCLLMATLCMLLSHDEKRFSELQVPNGDVGAGQMRRSRASACEAY
jgi:hypothetical protein